jgi:hypothetical protein
MRRSCVEPGLTPELLRCLVDDDSISFRRGPRRFAVRLLGCKELGEPGDAPASSRFRAGGETSGGSVTKARPVRHALAVRTERNRACGANRSTPSSSRNRSSRSARLGSLLRPLLSWPQTARHGSADGIRHLQAGTRVADKPGAAERRSNGASSSGRGAGGVGRSSRATPAGRDCR